MSSRESKRERERDTYRKRQRRDRKTEQQRQTRDRATETEKRQRDRDREACGFTKQKGCWFYACDDVVLHIFAT